MSLVPTTRLLATSIFAAALISPVTLLAQEPQPGGARGGMQAGRGGRGPQVTSPEVTSDHHVTFRLLAPNAQRVTLSAGDIPAGAFGPPEASATPGQGGGGRGGRPLRKGENGVWELTIGPVDPGAYRYNFNIDGVNVLDPRNTAVSESNAQNWSLVYVPGADFMDTKEVPHGAVASVTYYSKSLQRFRRMHVYTPPGYETSTRKYPVFYLLHGAGDCDDSWTSVGRAGFILDNLIAAGKAKPMIIVMPAGHTTQTGGGRAAPVAGQPARPMFDDDFVHDFVDDIMPYAESHYRIQADRAHRAIAGLSMGGAQTLYVAIPHLDKFGYIGVYSSGLFGIPGGAPAGGRGRGGANAAAPEGPNPVTTWMEENKATIDNPALKKDLKLFWFSTGRDDGLIATSKATVDLFNQHGFHATFQESPGAHTWINWRNYLNEFAPQLF